VAESSSEAASDEAASPRRRRGRRGGRRHRRGGSQTPVADTGEPLNETSDWPLVGDAGGLTQAQPEFDFDSLPVESGLSDVVPAHIPPASVPDNTQVATVAEAVVKEVR